MQGPRLPSHRIDTLPPSLSAPPSKNWANDLQTTAKSDEAKDDVVPPEEDNPETPEPPLLTIWARVKRHAAFVGPGVIASVAYIDPGNWATDLQAGSQFGYAHLFVVLLSGLIALLFQILCCRLGTVTGLDLAQECRLAMHNRPNSKYPKLWRWGALYPLYALAEVGIVFTDLAELLGSAIAINLLIPKIPLYACVLLTSLDVFLILLLFNNYPTKFVTRSMRLFELMIGLLVLVVLASFVALIVRVSPVWKDVFHGYVPGPGLVRGGGLYIAVGILGATCMPHALFLSSKMATMKRLAPSQYEFVTPAARAEELRAAAETDARPQVRLHLPQPMSLGSYNLRRESEGDVERASLKKEIANERPSLACAQAHLGHAVVDIAGSLLGFAILINSSILILAASVFYYGQGKTTNGTGISDLFDAYDLVKEYVGQAFAFLFAIGLLAAGQSASLTVTLAGQVLSEGFLHWRTTPWKRRVITRSIGIIPSVAVASAVGRDGLDVLLVGSQVALSVVLPFVIAPLIIFTTSQHLMSLPIDPSLPSSPPSPTQPPKTVWEKLNPFRRRRGAPGYVSFANGTAVVYISSLLWCMIVAANVYALYDLGKGDE